MKTDQSKNGKTISHAIEIMRKTYDEIEHIKDDISRILPNISETYDFRNLYSYKKTNLRLRSDYTCMWNNIPAKTKDPRFFEAFVMMVIFYGDTYMVGDGTEPEIWFQHFQLQNYKGNSHAMYFREVLSKDEMQDNYIGVRPRLGGTISRYHWEEDSNNKRKEIWDGKVMGHHLTRVRGKEWLEKKIQKLHKH